MKMVKRIKYATNVQDMVNAFSPRELTDEELTEFYYDNTMPVRTGSPVRSPIKDIYYACQDASQTNKFLLLGHRGCGKSTELNVLARRFREEGFPVYTVQCAQDLDMLRPLYSDLMILMGDALVRIVKDMGFELEEEDKALLNKLARFWDQAKEEREETEDHELSAEAGAKAETPKLFEMIFGLFASVKSSVKLGEISRKVY